MENMFANLDQVRSTENTLNHTVLKEDLGALLDLGLFSEASDEQLHVIGKQLASQENSRKGQEMNELKRSEIYQASTAAGECIDHYVDDLVKLAVDPEAPEIRAKLGRLFLYQEYLVHCLEELPESEDRVILGFRKFNQIASIWEEDA